MFSIREKVNVLPKKRSLTIEVIHFCIAVSLLVIATQIRINLPFTPVPISFQVITALILGAAYGPKKGFFYTFSYVILLTFAFPSLGSGFPGIMFASFGYLGAMPLGAALCGYLHNKLQSKSILLRSVPLIAGTLSIYALGLPWLAMFVGWSHVLEFGLYPFIALDLARATAAGAAFMFITGKK